MGITRTEDGKHIKLDDPSSARLDGAGHVMSETELATEMNMYSAIEERRYPTDHPLIKKIHILDFHEGKGSISNADYIDPEVDKFYVKFPFSVTDYSDDRSPKQVRSCDSVKVGVCGMLTLSSGETQTYREVFWAFVVSVSSLGCVIAVSKSTLKSGASNEADMFWFPLPASSECTKEKTGSKDFQVDVGGAHGETRRRKIASTKMWVSLHEQEQSYK